MGYSDNILNTMNLLRLELKNCRLMTMVKPMVTMVKMIFPMKETRLMLYDMSRSNMINLTMINSRKIFFLLLTTP